MKLIIDIDEGYYKIITNKIKAIRDEISKNGYANNDVVPIGWGSIADGTPLPKGHGDLIDIQPLMRGLYEEMSVGELTYTTSEVYKMLEEECPVIIEADKDNKEK